MPPGKTDGAAIPAEDAGTILLVEHPPVYTLGKSGRAENLLIPKAALEAMGAKFFHIDRGGDITFHGPGQLVCYPILDLERLGIGLREYIASLEAVIRTTARLASPRAASQDASGVDRRGATPDGEGTPAQDMRNRSAFVALCHHARVRAERLDRPEVVLAHQPCGFTDRGVASIARKRDARSP